jgi:hypothetical protein
MGQDGLHLEHFLSSTGHCFHFMLDGLLVRMSAMVDKIVKEPQTANVPPVWRALLAANTSAAIWGH